MFFSLFFSHNPCHLTHHHGILDHGGHQGSGVPRLCKVTISFLLPPITFKPMFVCFCHWPLKHIKLTGPLWSRERKESLMEYRNPACSLGEQTQLISSHSILIGFVALIVGLATDREKKRERKFSLLFWPVEDLNSLCFILGLNIISHYHHFLHQKSSSSLPCAITHPALWCTILTCLTLYPIITLSDIGSDSSEYSCMVTSTPRVEKLVCYITFTTRPDRIVAS